VGKALHAGDSSARLAIWPVNWDLAVYMCGLYTYADSDESFERAFHRLARGHYIEIQLKHTVLVMVSRLGRLLGPSVYFVFSKWSVFLELPTRAKGSGVGLLDNEWE